MIIPNIWENKIDVPNHQPVFHWWVVDYFTRVFCRLDSLRKTGFSENMAPRCPKKIAVSAQDNNDWLIDNLL